MKNNKKDMRTIGMKVMLSFMTFSLLLWNCGFYSQAANYGEKAGNWFLEQLFWIGIAIVAFILVTCLLKRAWITAIITFVCGGIILVVIKEPELIPTVGKNIADVILK